MEQEILVEVQNVSKKFCKDLKTSLKYGFKDLFGNVFGTTNTMDLRPKEFWAVKDVSFTLKRGECLGLIGHNGAGKSTLLKILNGLIKPDAGTVTMRGKVGALIELGAGFNPILTGRENIYNNGAVLGFSKEEIKNKIEEIIDFSEIREFIDMPVQYYSSGMKVRLGFAVAAQLEPDVLIVDEVLAVGDLGFKIKCLNRIGELLQKCAVILVSHSMPQISRVCSRGILLERGKIISKTQVVSEVISNYYHLFENNEERVIGVENVNAKVINSLVGKNDFIRGEIINQGDQLELIFEFNWKIKVNRVKLKVFFINIDTRNIMDLPSELCCESFEINQEEKSKIKLKTEPLFLNGGNYTLTLVVQNADNQERLYRHDNIFDITIYSKYFSWSDVVSKADWSKIN